MPRRAWQRMNEEGTLTELSRGPRRVEPKAHAGSGRGGLSDSSMSASSAASGSLPRSAKPVQWPCHYGNNSHRDERPKGHSTRLAGLRPRKVRLPAGHLRGEGSRSWTFAREIRWTDAAGRKSTAIRIMPEFIVCARSATRSRTQRPERSCTSRVSSSKRWSESGSISPGKFTRSSTS